MSLTAVAAVEAVLAARMLARAATEASTEAEEAAVAVVRHSGLAVLAQTGWQW